MSKKKTAIAIVDDHTLFRSGLANLLEEFDEIEVVFEAINGADFQEKLIHFAPIKVVLMDISMPIMDGFITSRWLKENYPDIHILALSMFEDEKAIIEMLKAGAGGYLLKESKPSDLLTAIQTIEEKGFYINELVSGRLLSALKKEPLKAVFTEKELIFLQLCSTESTYKEIAIQMNVGHRTVDNYREALFGKLSIKSRTGLVVYGIKNGLIR
ncbi:MAG: response regulator transcription factor, partial [Chitinophagaceae bacterium]